MFNEKNVSRIRKKTFFLQFCMGTPESLKTSKVHIGSIRRSLQAQPKILKKLLKPKSTNQDENSSKNVCLVN
jgi:hypothetical protein